MSPSQKPVKKHTFRNVMLISILVFVIALLIGLLWFFNWLQDYENSERHHVAEQTVAALSSGEYLAVAQNTDVVISGLENAETYAEEIRKLVEGKTLTYAKAFSYDRFEHPAYKIKADGQDVCKLVLKKSGKSKHNFDTYSVDYFTGFAFGKGSAAFLLPSYYTAYCNGVELDSKYITQDGLNTELFGYALTDEAKPSMCRYEITGLSSQAVIEAVDAYGDRITFTGADGKYEAEFKSLRFSVPEGTVVTVRGVVLDERFTYGAAQPENAGSGEDPVAAPMLSGGILSSSYVNYRVDYLSPDVDFTVTDNSGKALELTLSPEGVYTVGVKIYTVLAPEGCAVTANGIPLTGEGTYIAETGIEVDELKTILAEYLPERPVLTRYRFALPDTEAAPEVRVQNVRGEWQTPEPENDTYTFTFRVAENIPELTELAITRTYHYAEYITNDRGKETFMATVLRNQPIYQELADNPYYFYTGHKRHWKENEAWKDLRYYTENCFSCEVTFDYFIADIRTNHDLVASFPLDVRFWYVKYNGSWYMAEWEIITATANEG